MKSGVYSRSGRILSSRAAEIADAIMSVPYVREPDEFAAAEVGRLIALIEAMDYEIDTNGLTRRAVDRQASASGVATAGGVAQPVGVHASWPGRFGEHDCACRARGRDRATASPPGRELKCGTELQDNQTWSALEGVGAGQLSN